MGEGGSGTRKVIGEGEEVKKGKEECLGRKGSGEEEEEELEGTERDEEKKESSFGE